MKAHHHGWLGALAGLVCSAVVATGAGTRTPLTVSTADSAARSTSAEIQVAFPGEHTFWLHAPGPSWVDLSRLEFEIHLPSSGPTNTQVLVHLKDWDYFWYQNLPPGYLVPGRRNRFVIDLLPSAPGWEPRGHHGTWHLRALMEPREVGVRVFAPGTYEGTCAVSRVYGYPRAPGSAPFIRHVEVNATRIPRYGKFEVTFQLPDRYPDPFDSDEISVTARIRTPDDRTVIIDGYFGRSYYREVAATGDHISPQGPPFWRVRYSPIVPGRHEYTIKARDEFGETDWGPGTFHAGPSELPGFVRVSRTDPRYFEFDSRAPFFPIGHNIRSPFDVRHDKQFPWLQRWPEGSAAYLRYFRDMEKHGETLTEIWTAAWSLGLEWSPKWRGYHGIGQYNMKNAWELDRVLDEAERRGIYINLVVHNHGKFGTRSDREWEYNPFNTQNGGYLRTPQEYFTDPRALKAFRQLMRYMIARWGYSTHILAWELWSELNLTGDGGNFYRRPEVVDWHRLMGRAVKRMDPNRHLISTHYSGDYNVQNLEIVTLPEMDLAPVDAYHSSTDPLQIVSLMARTAIFNNRFAKPVLITEFGGSSRAQDIRHLDDALHAALWASPCVPLGATPMFWWWQVVEEEDFYPKFAAIRRFTEDEDFRGPDMKMCSGLYVPPSPDAHSNNVRLLLEGKAPTGVAVICLRNNERAYGWIHHTARFEEIDPEGTATMTNLVVSLGGMSAGRYRAEFWNTKVGVPVSKARLAASDGELKATSPPFARDIAFKIKKERSGF